MDSKQIYDYLAPKLSIAERESLDDLCACICAEARAEADTKIAYWKRWVSGLCERIEEQWPRGCDASQEANAARAAILADEPKEERETPKICLGCTKSYATCGADTFTTDENDNFDWCADFEPQVSEQKAERAAILADEPKEERGEEAGWMIEKPGPIVMWWNGRPKREGNGAWSSDSNDGIRFCRRFDAELCAIAQGFSLSKVLITEHRWG